MSQENVENMLEIYELLNTRFVALKGVDMDDLLAFFHTEVVIKVADQPDPETYNGHADVEFIPRRAAVQGTYHGHAGMRKYITENAESFDLFEVGNTEFRDLGDRVLAFGTVRVRGRESGVEVTHPTALLVAFQDGKII